MIIDLDTSLKPAVLEPAVITKLAEKLAARDIKARMLVDHPDMKAYIEKQGKPAIFDELIAHDISDLNAHHTNYMEYLLRCWSSHYGVVLTPDIFWFTILNEVAIIIREAPDKYRALFTDKPDKTEILVPGTDPAVLNIEDIITALKGLVPSNVEAFLPDFTTSTATSKLAMNAAFCDAVSPFYSYSMYLCGITRVDIRGEKADWQKVAESVAYVGGLLSDITASLAPYFKRVTKILDRIYNPTKEFMSAMIDFPTCGSGSQIEATGWFTELFVKQPRPAYPGNYSTHIATVNYKVKWEPNSDFALRTGVFSSAIDGNGFLVPSFNRIVHRVAVAQPA